MSYALCMPPVGVKKKLAMSYFLYPQILSTKVMRTGGGTGAIRAPEGEGATLAPRPPPQRVATISNTTNYHEKTTLLSSDDEFQ